MRGTMRSLKRGTARSTIMCGDERAAPEWGMVRGSACPTRGDDLWTVNDPDARSADTRLHAIAWIKLPSSPGADPSSRVVLESLVWRSVEL